MEDIELKPCPFCGGKARIRMFRTFIERVHGMDDKFYVTCTGCYIDGPGYHLTESDAADAWNRRA